MPGFASINRGTPMKLGSETFRLQQRCSEGPGTSASDSCAGPFEH